eukprot:1192271-Prorocentrum_minimum.AAC.1
MQLASSSVSFRSCSLFLSILSASWWSASASATRPASACARPLRASSLHRATAPPSRAASSSSCASASSSA